MEEKTQRLIIAAKKLIELVEESIGDKSSIEEMQDLYKRLGSAVSGLEIAIYDVEKCN